MKKQCALLTALALAAGTPAGMWTPFGSGFEAIAQTTNKVTGTVTDMNGEPLIGASVVEKGRKGGSVTDSDGKFSIAAPQGSTLVISYIGYKPKEVKVTGSAINVQLQEDSESLNEVVVTALGIKREKKALGYAMDDLSADELMKNKTANPLSSLSGKVPGVNITQSSGAAGSGAQIILRGGTSGSESRDNQPLIVVDGIIYDNSSSVGGNSAFDGSTSSSTTSSNRLMDINPEDIENMSILKGPAAAALYGSRAANGVILITTKKGKSGSVEVNLSTKYTTSWVKDVPEAQTEFKRGYMNDVYKDGVYQGAVYDDFAYTSWGERRSANDPAYDNIGDFFRHGNIWDTNVSVAGGSETGNFYLSGSYFNQDGVVPQTGYTKTTFRFNGEQKWRMFTFGANAAFSQARTDKTLTSGGLYGSSGNGALQRIYAFGTTDDMRHYMNEDGSRYRMFGDRLDPWDESDNPYWIINKNKLHDKTTRFTGSFNVKADIADWWWLSFRMGIDRYDSNNSKRLAPGGVYKNDWQNGMMSDNRSIYEYINTNLMTNFSKSFGEFNFNLLGGMTTDNTRIDRDYKMAYGFEVPGFFSYNNASDTNKNFQSTYSRKRLVGVYGEFRADWKNTLFLTATGRNDWTSTLPKENRSYFYPSVSGAFLFTTLLQDLHLMDQSSILSFGKIRASWAKVGKDTSPYETATSLWPVKQMLGGMVGIGNNWTRGNTYLKPEMTKSTEIGVELHFFRNRLKFDYAYYTNDSYNQIVSPRTTLATGYIFCSYNAGNVLNKGMELAISGTPIDTPDWTWETGINVAGNRGKLEGLMEGMDIMYVTDVQYSSAKAASFSGGHFMAIAGNEWQTVKYNSENASDPNNQFVGMTILDKTGMPLTDDTTIEVGNREPKFSGGWNNTLRWKNLTFNMLWEFRVGGHVYNGTKLAMTNAGTSLFSAEVRNQPLIIDGVENVGTTDDPVYEARHYEFYPDRTYDVNGVMKSGYNIIKSYYTGAYPSNTANYLTKVNSLRMRTISLSYDVPRKWLAKTKAIKRAVFTASANNLLLFTNYDGDPEVAASGAGVGGSSSVGFDYCGIPSTASFSFGLNVTF